MICYQKQKKTLAIIIIIIKNEKNRFTSKQYEPITSQDTIRYLTDIFFFFVNDDTVNNNYGDVMKKKEGGGGLKRIITKTKRYFIYPFYR